jgi:hypothetical protein
MEEETMHDAVAHQHEPVSSDNLLLDIGGSTGALVIYATGDRDQAEIEISPSASEQARAHNVVRLRQAPGGPVYAAVFPALPAGEYVVWQDDHTRAGTVAVPGGQVASFRVNQSDGQAAPRPPAGSVPGDLPAVDMQDLPGDIRG